MELRKDDIARDIQTPSWKLRYYEAGPADGTPVVLLHGSGPGATGWSNFAGNIGPIAEAGFRVLAVDMPGWGDSDACTNEELDHVAAAIEFLDALGIEKAAFVGNSMGGHTTLRLATLHPDRTTHLVTMGPPIGRHPGLFGAGDGPSEGLKVLKAAYVDPSPENMKRLVEIMTFDKARFATDELTRARSEAALARPDHLKNYVDGTAKRGPVPVWVELDKLAGITQPALLIHGKDDRVTHYEKSLILLSNIPNSRALLLNRCGHWAMIEHAEEFNRQVIDFISHT